MPEQLSFDLPIKTAQGREDFFVSTANAQAVALIDSWQDWPAHKLVLVGPAASGKSHLTQIWAEMSGATVISALDLTSHDIPALTTGPVAVEDCDQIAGQRPAEEALFHLHNLALAEGQSLLLTARSAPNFWPLTLPDLASRLQATTTVALDAPDDALLTALLAKHFNDRQIAPAPDLISYLVRRIDRSGEAAREIVTTLDETALAQGRGINRALARQLLDKTPN